jgi:hypothetical protein
VHDSYDVGLADFRWSRSERFRYEDWSGHTPIESALRTLFVWEQGDLSLDDIVVAEPFATVMESLGWVFSSLERRPV